MKKIVKQIRAIGTLTLLAAGLLSAACEGFTDPPRGTAKTITVLPTSGTTNLVVGQAAAFQARAVDVSGDILTGKYFEWGSTNESVAVVSPYGIVTPLRAGSTTIVASTDDRMGTIRITVSNPPPGN
jgi:uncharacterized protein YjdB